VKKVKYNGAHEAHLTTINKVVKNGDVIEVEDGFENALFELVVEKKEEKISKSNKEVTK
jgi:hypothetical protein